MLYLKYTYVDAETGVPVTEAPATNGPKPPEIDGLSYSFALESQYPTIVPIFFGTAPDGIDTGAAGVLDAIDSAGYEAARAAELEARKAIKQRQRKDVRMNAINAGFEYGGTRVDSDLESRSLIQGAVSLAQLALADGSQGALDAFAASLGDGWRGENGTVVATDAPGIITLAQALSGHIAACDGASQAIKTLIDAAADFAELGGVDLTAGYPSSE